jgi:pimeloyl-ACP methyl ester carboxylesterase
MVNKLITIAAISSLSLSLFFVIVAHYSPLVNSQLENKKHPVLLIHGYASGPSVWKNWELLLKADNITFKTVEYKDNVETWTNEDGCGSAVDHAQELNDIVEDFRKSTQSEEINIVAHSKGGLDARVYLHTDPSNAHIENLIMIGTPNLGSPLAYVNELCSPAIFDIRPGSDATKATKNENTRYFTIAGNWTPALEPKSMDSNCSPSQQFLLDFQRGGYFALNSIPGFSIPNDGIVPVSSVHLIGTFNNLGNTDNCHTDLLGDEEYAKSREILLGLK